MGLDGEKQTQTQSCQDWGALDLGGFANLGIRKHIAAEVKSFTKLHLVCQLHPFLDQEALQIVRHALAISCLDSYIAFYMGLALMTTQKLQLIQNAIAQAMLACLGMSMCHYSSYSFTELLCTI